MCVPWLARSHASRVAGSAGPGIPDALLAGVQGAITGKDVLVHSLTILRLWGPTVYIRCLRAVVQRRPCTFLGVLVER
jgi:hypothetical protein